MRSHGSSLPNRFRINFQYTDIDAMEKLRNIVSPDAHISLQWITNFFNWRPQCWMTIYNSQFTCDIAHLGCSKQMRNHFDINMIRCQIVEGFKISTLSGKIQLSASPNISVQNLPPKSLLSSKNSTRRASDSILKNFTN